jgi:hypothetical protein
MRVDASVLFSIIFVERQYVGDIDENDLVTLEYKMLGDTSLLNDVQGVWTDVTVTIPQKIALIHSEELFTIDVTIFVALGPSPDAGLDGVLSICITP